MYEDIIRILLRTKRAERDYQSFSKLIGYSYNHYFKLESGYKKLSMEEFINIFQKSDPRCLKEIFLNNLGIKITATTQEDIIQGYCDKFSDPSKYLLESVLNFSMSKWWRIKNNKTKLSFNDFLKLINLTGNDSLSLLRTLINDRDKLKYRSDINFRDLQNKLLKDSPEASLILAAVDDINYKGDLAQHSLENIQKKCGLEKNNFFVLFNQLLEIGSITFDEQTKKYQRVEYKLESRTHTSFELSKSLFSYVANKQVDHLKNNLNKDKITFGTKIVTVSPQTIEAIKDEMKKTYDKISHLVENDDITKESEMFLFQFCLNASSNSEEKYI